jgi:hypothetical protein
MLQIQDGDQVVAEEAIPLGTYLTGFQTEVMAILVATEKLFEFTIWEK